MNSLTYKQYIVSFTAYYGSKNEYVVRLANTPIVGVGEVSGLDFVDAIARMIWNGFGIRVNAVEIHSIYGVPEPVK